MDKEFNLKKLFWSTFTLSAFTFGGGYVIVMLMKQRFVQKYHWLTENEMLDFVAIAQSAPGAMAINGAILVGYKLAGVIGVLITVLATVLPPIGIITILAYLYNVFIKIVWVQYLLSGMQVAVGTLILQVVLDMLLPIVRNKKGTAILIFLLVLGASLLFNVSSVYLILACLAYGIIQTLRGVSQCSIYNYGGVLSKSDY